LIYFEIKSIEASGGALRQGEENETEQWALGYLDAPESVKYVDGTGGFDELICLPGNFCGYGIWGKWKRREWGSRGGCRYGV
jgi:hypothetical protein